MFPVAPGQGPEAALGLSKADLGAIKKGMAAGEAAVTLRSRPSFSLILINPIVSQISQSRDYLRFKAFQKKKLPALTKEDSTSRELAFSKAPLIRIPRAQALPSKLHIPSHRPFSAADSHQQIWKVNSARTGWREKHLQLCGS